MKKVVGDLLRNTFSMNVGIILFKASWALIQTPRDPCFINRLVLEMDMFHLALGRWQSIPSCPPEYWRIQQSGDIGRALAERRFAKQIARVEHPSVIVFSSKMLALFGMMAHFWHSGGFAIGACGFFHPAITQASWCEVDDDTLMILNRTAVKSKQHSGSLIWLKKKYELALSKKIFCLESFSLRSSVHRKTWSWHFQVQNLTISQIWST